MSRREWPYYTVTDDNNITHWTAGPCRFVRRRDKKRGPNGYHVTSSNRWWCTGNVIPIGVKVHKNKIVDCMVCATHPPPGNSYYMKEIMAHYEKHKGQLFSATLNMQNLPRSKKPK